MPSELLLLQQHLRWFRHLIRVHSSIFPIKYYMDNLLASATKEAKTYKFNICFSKLEALAADHNNWKSTSEIGFQSICRGTTYRRHATSISLPADTAVLPVTKSVQLNLDFRSLGPFYGAIAVPSVTRCRCSCRGHRCAGGVRQWRRATVATLGEWQCKIRACGGS